MILINNFSKKYFTLSISVLILFTSLLLSCSSDCQNDIIQSQISPDGKYIAISFYRSCGATTGISPQVSIIKSHMKLPNSPGNLFISDKSDKIKIFWKDSTTLVIQYDKNNARVFKAMEDFNSILIIYQDSSL